jgi:apolipoprotein N-acyltransferase
MVLVQEAGLSNSAVLATPDARVLGIYDKQRLIPIGERDLLPDLFGARPLVSAATPFRVVRAVKALRLGSIRLLVTICYEDMLPSAFRSNVRRTAPDLLVNLGSARWFRGSSASALHLGLAKLRAVEHRRFLIRVTKDGVSAVVSPSGRVVRQLESARRQSGVAEVRLLRHRTVYAYLGDAPWFVGALACLLACVAPAPSPSARAPGLSPAPRAAPSPPSGRACRSPR